MNRNNNFTARLYLILLGILPVGWLGLHLAPHLEDGLLGIMEGFQTAMERPFAITLVAATPKCVMGCLCIYGLAVGVAMASQRNTRNGEEHGSARWGNARMICKQYCAAIYTANLIFTQSIRLGLDSHKHRRNLNVLIVGGSGAGKTRFYAKPNLYQANTSFVILDPKGELTRDAGALLEAMGYEVRVLDLIKALKENAALFAFMQENGITSMQALHETVSAMNDEYYELRGKIVSAERRIHALTERMDMWEQYEKYKPIRRQLDSVKPRKRDAFAEQHRAELALFDASKRYLDKLTANGEKVTPKAWRAEVAKLAQQKEADNEQLKKMRDRIKAMESIRKTADQLARAEQDRPKCREPER